MLRRGANPLQEVHLCELLQVSQPPTDRSCWGGVALFGDRREDKEKGVVLRAGGSEFAATASDFCSLGSPGGHHNDHEPAMCSCCTGGKWYPGLHCRECCQPVEGGDLPPLPSTGEDTPGVLGPVLDSPVYKRDMDMLERL